MTGNGCYSAHVAATIHPFGIIRALCIVNSDVERAKRTISLAEPRKAVK